MFTRGRMFFPRRLTAFPCVVFLHLPTPFTHPGTLVSLPSLSSCEHRRYARRVQMPFPVSGVPSCEWNCWVVWDHMTDSSRKGPAVPPGVTFCSQQQGPRGSPIRGLHIGRHYLQTETSLLLPFQRGCPLFLFLVLLLWLEFLILR